MSLGCGAAACAPAAFAPANGRPMSPAVSVTRMRARALARTTLQGFVAAHGSAVPQEYFSSLNLEQNEPLQRMAG